MSPPPQMRWNTSPTMKWSWSTKSPRNGTNLAAETGLVSKWLSPIDDFYEGHEGQDLEEGGGGGGRAENLESLIRAK